MVIGTTLDIALSSVAPCSELPIALASASGETYTGNLAPTLPPSAPRFLQKTPWAHPKLHLGNLPRQSRLVTLDVHIGWRIEVWASPEECLAEKDRSNDHYEAD